MNVFEKPVSQDRDIYYSATAPWKKSAGQSNGWNDSATNNFGSHGTEAIASAVRLKLDVCQLLGSTLTALGVIGILGGMVVLATCCSGRHSHRPAHPVIANSFVLTILTGIGIIVAAVIIECIATSLMKKRQEIFKREIVQKRLEHDCEILDYFYTDVSKEEGYAVQLLQKLFIRDNSWKELKFNDYIVGKYHSAPFIFFDCTLNKTIKDKGDKNHTYTHFKGQILIFKMKHAVDFGCQFYIDSAGINVAPSYSIFSAFEDLLTGKKNLKDQIELAPDEMKDDVVEVKQKKYEVIRGNLNDVDRVLEGVDKDALLSFMESYKDIPIDKINEDNLSEQEIELLKIYTKHQKLCEKLAASVKKIEKPKKARTDEEAMHEAKEYLTSKLSQLNEVNRNAQCNVGWIISGCYLVVILENTFDPFEFSFSDLFRSNKKVVTRVDKQAQWLISIMEPHLRAGLI
ncbi:MAG: hypothetical protein IJU23_10910 [Proteobacteria bacterium]|nr:hypothetical protein [Pseudomonadota bacterium]